VGLALLIAPFLPLRKDRADAYWNQVRLVQGLVWLAMVAWIAWQGESNGLVAMVSRDAVVDWLTPIR